MLLLPQDLREWVPEGHLAHHVSDLVDALDLGAFYAPYKGDGRRNSPYDPRMMVKVLIYAYGTATFSSRKMAGKLEEDIAFRMLAAGNFPQHRTLCEFRRRHLKDFQAVFAEVVLRCPGTTSYVRPRAIGGPWSWGILRNQGDGFIVSGAGGSPPWARWGRTVLYSRLHCSTSTVASGSV